MSALGHRITDAEVWDLFAGSGALGLEALSRGAAAITFVDRARGSIATVEANIELVGASDECTVVADDVFRFLGRATAPADLALADPPYGTGDATRLVELWLEARFAKELWLEHPWRESLPLPPDARTRRYGDTALTTLTDS